MRGMEGGKKGLRDGRISRDEQVDREMIARLVGRQVGKQVDR